MIDTSDSSRNFSPSSLRPAPLDAPLRPSGRTGITAQRGCLCDREGALAPHTKSVHAISESVDEKTGEIQRFTFDKKRREYCAETDIDDRLRSARSERFSLQRMAADILSHHDRITPVKSANKARKSLDGVDPTRTRWRVTKCNWVAFDNVDVLHDAKHGRAHYKNLMTCGSVWTCPVCAAKISARRAQEIQKACDVHTDSGGSLYMATLTFSHSRHDDLKALVGDSKRSGGLRAALRRYRNSRAYKNCRELIGLVGLVRNLEVTYSDANGWHPHVHELWFLPRKLPRWLHRQVMSSLFVAWHDACVKSGLSAPNRKRGLHLEHVDSPAEYLAKTGREQNWGAKSELTMSHIKRGHMNSMTPFDLLRVASSGTARSSQARSLFAEFARVFHGSRQLFWTRGLKALFGLDDQTDEEIAAEQTEEATLITTIAKPLWKKLLSLTYDARGLVLTLAETGGQEAVQRYLSSLSPG